MAKRGKRASLELEPTYQLLDIDIDKEIIIVVVKSTIGRTESHG